MLFNRIKPSGVLQLILRYIAEVTIIFLGITISFLFEQWREEQRKKEDLIELSESLLKDIDTYKARLAHELSASKWLIESFDSLRVERTLNIISERHIKDFYRMVSGKGLFIFDPNSPSYSTAAASGLVNELSDTIRNALYQLYQVEMPLFKLTFDKQEENITHFRNNALVSSNTYLYDDREGSPLQVDFQKFAKEIQRPVYGNFINVIIDMEKTVYMVNESISRSLTALEVSLRKYLKELKA